jgi:hypothetical protein
MNVAKLSLSQMSVHHAIVTRLPNHWCAISWAIVTRVSRRWREPVSPSTSSRMSRKLIAPQFSIAP